MLVDANIAAGQPVLDRPVTRQVDHPVGELGDAFEPVLGEDHGHAEVVDEPGDGGEDLLGRRRVEGRRGLVEHEDRGGAR